MKKILAVALMLVMLFQTAFISLAAPKDAISFSVSDAAANKGEDVIISVSLNSDAYSMNICGLSFSLSYDNTKLKYITGDNAESLLASPVVYDNVADSKVVFAWSAESNVLIPCNRVICNFRFKILDDAEGESTEVKFNYNSGYSINNSDSSFNDFAVKNKTTKGTVAFSVTDSAVEKVISLITAIGTVEYNEKSLGKILSAMEAYSVLTKEQKEKVSNYQDLIDAQKEYERLKLIAENEPIADEISKFINDNSKVFKLTVETVKLSDKDKVIDAINAYNKLSNDAKFAVHSYYVQLKNLNTKIELLQKAKDEADAALKADAELRKEAETLAKQFRNDNKYILGLKSKDIMSFHGEPIQTALGQLEALSGINIYIKEYLKNEEALLLGLLSVWETITKEEELTPEQQQAQNFKNTFAYVLSLTEKTVTADDVQELAIAMSVYDVLSDEVKALLANEYALISKLHTKASTLAGQLPSDEQPGNDGSIGEGQQGGTVYYPLSADQSMVFGVRNIGVFTIILMIMFLFTTFNLATLFVFYNFYYKKKVDLLNNSKGGNE